jgi:hypothetical protein
MHNPRATTQACTRGPRKQKILKRKHEKGKKENAKHIKAKGKAIQRHQANANLDKPKRRSQPKQTKQKKGGTKKPQRQQ